MESLYVAGKPTNLTFAEGVKAEEITSDLFGVMDRIAEKHPAVHVIKIVDEDGHVFVAMERDLEGTDHLMFRFHEIDQRLEERLDRIKAIPLEQRYQEAQRIEEESKAAIEQEAKDKLYEDFGIPLRRQLLRDGFGSGTVGTSYRKRVKQ